MVEINGQSDKYRKDRNRVAIDDGKGEEIIQKVKEIRLKAQEDMRLVRDSHD